MNMKLEKTFREGKYEIQDGGDGTFFCLEYEPSKNEEKEIFETAQLFFDDVQWCPDPDSHGEQFHTVLNCFYPVERGENDENYSNKQCRLGKCPYCDKEIIYPYTWDPNDECVIVNCECGGKVHFFMVDDELKTFKPENCPDGLAI